MPSMPAVGKLDEGALPELGDLTGTGVASNLPEGGETAARSRLSRWLREGLARYDTRRDDLAIAGTSGLSPYLHFGCLSALEVAHRAATEPGGEPGIDGLPPAGTEALGQRPIQRWAGLHPTPRDEREPERRHQRDTERHPAHRRVQVALRKRQQGRGK